MVGHGTFDELLARQPVLDQLLLEFERAVVSGPLDARLLGLCRATVAKLLRDGTVTAATPAAPRDLDARERACVAFTEMYVMDAHAVTDDMCADVRAHLGDAGATALTLAVALFDATSRSRAALGVA
jgi:alkylhydroperoxidase family enzyme